MEEQCYILDVQQHIQMALDENARQLDNWEKRKAAWLIEADIARANAQPLPEKPVPAWKKSVTATPFVIGQPYEITDKSGPERVADPTLELPLIPSFEASAFPQGVQAVGPYAGWGDTWVALPQDTIKDGEVVTHEGKQLRKVERRGFGNLRLSFYLLVK